MIWSGRPTLRALVSVVILGAGSAVPAFLPDASTPVAATGATPTVRSTPQPPEPEVEVPADDEVIDLLVVTPSRALDQADRAWNDAQDAEQAASDGWVEAEQTRLDLWGLKTVADFTVADGFTKLAASQAIVDGETATLYRLRVTEQDRRDELDAHVGELREMAAAAYSATTHDDPIGLGTFDQMARGNRRDTAITTVMGDRSNQVKRAQIRWTTANGAADDQQDVLTEAQADRDEKSDLVTAFTKVRDGYVSLHDEAKATVEDRTDGLTAARTKTADTREDRRSVRLTSTVSALGFSLVAADAYWQASGRASCHMPWWLLAGVGRVESGHGTARGSRLTDAGDTTTRILGIPLDGTRDTAAVRDTDGSLLDGDGTWDRAVGPMQFIPGTWGRWAADGNGDGLRDPHNLYDASAAAARYLCNVRGDVTSDFEARIALLAYNRSGPYGLIVVDQGRRYQSSVDLPEIRPPDPEPSAATTPG